MKNRKNRIKIPVGLMHSIGLLLAQNRAGEYRILSNKRLLSINRPSLLSVSFFNQLILNAPSPVSASSPTNASSYPLSLMQRVQHEPK